MRAPREQIDENALAREQSNDTLGNDQLGIGLGLGNICKYVGNTLGSGKTGAGEGGERGQKRMSRKFVNTAARFLLYSLQAHIDA